MLIRSDKCCRMSCACSRRLVIWCSSWMGPLVAACSPAAATFSYFAAPHGCWFTKGSNVWMIGSSKKVLYIRITPLKGSSRVNIVAYDPAREVAEIPLFFNIDMNKCQYVNAAYRKVFLQDLLGCNQEFLPTGCCKIKSVILATKNASNHWWARAMGGS